MSAQAAFAASLLDPHQVVPDGLVAWNGSDIGARYAVYRNNVAVALVNAVQDSFPVCCEHIGHEIFRTLALRFVRAAPPRSPVLAAYGAEFPAFIEHSEAAESRPELADLARLEWLRVRAFHAADAMPLSPEQLAAVLAQPEQLPALRLRLLPSVCTLASHHPVVSIWAAHQGLIDSEATAAINASARHAVVARPELDVEVLAVSLGIATFVRLLATGIPLAAAAAEASAADCEFDLVAGLTILIRHRLIAAVITSAEDSR